MDKVLISCIAYFRNVNLTLLNVTQIGLCFWSRLEELVEQTQMSRDSFEHNQSHPCNIKPTLELGSF